MIFQELSNSIEVNSFIEIAWFTSSILFILLGGFIIIQITRHKLSSRFFMGVSVFGFCFGIARLIENIRIYFISTEKDDILNAWIQGGQITGVNLGLRISYYVICWIAIAYYLHEYEILILQRKTKFFFTYSAIGEGIVSIMNYIPSIRSNYTVYGALVGFFLGAVLPLIAQFIVALRTKDRVMRKAFTMAGFGLIIFLLGLSGDLPEGKYFLYIWESPINDNFVLSIISPILLLTGIIIMFFGYYRLFQREVEPAKWLSNLWVIDAQSGICIFEINFMDLKFEPDLVSGFLVAMMNFGRELADNEIQQIRFKNLSIYFLNQNNLLVTAAVKELGVNKQVDLFLETVLMEFSNQYKDALKNFQGDVSIFNNFRDFIEYMIQKQSVGIYFLKSKLLKSIGEEA